MALRAEIVDFGRGYALENLRQIRAFSQVAVVHVDPRIEGQRSGANGSHPMHFVTVGEQEFGQVRTVLTAHTRHQRDRRFLAHALVSPSLSHSATLFESTWPRKGVLCCRLRHQTRKLRPA